MRPGIHVQGQSERSLVCSLLFVAVQLARTADEVQLARTADEAVQTQVQLRTLTLSGFEVASFLNTEYSERHQSVLSVQGEETYWSLGDTYFVHHCTRTQNWVIAAANYLSSATKCDCSGFAIGDIFSSSTWVESNGTVWYPVNVNVSQTSVSSLVNISGDAANVFADACAVTTTSAKIPANLVVAESDDEYDTGYVVIAILGSAFFLLCICSCWLAVVSHRHYSGKARFGFSSWWWREVPEVKSAKDLRTPTPIAPFVSSTFRRQNSPKCLGKDIHLARISCKSRLPKNGDEVYHTLGCKSSYKYMTNWGLEAAEGIWKLPAGQVAIVVQVDKAGEFRLRNVLGHESAFLSWEAWFFCEDEPPHQPPECHPPRLLTSEGKFGGLCQDSPRQLCDNSSKPLGC